MAAKSKGTPAHVAQTREALLAQHQEARHRRDAADLGSAAYREATQDVERIEVAIAALERSMDPPRM